MNLTKYLTAGLVICLVIILTGCEDYYRQLRISEWRDRFVNACLPRKGDTVTAYWHKGTLLCKRITPTGRYGQTFPHAEVRVATIEEVEL